MSVRVKPFSRGPPLFPINFANEPPGCRYISFPCAGRVYYNNVTYGVLAGAPVATQPLRDKYEHVIIYIYTRRFYCRGRYRRDETVRKKNANARRIHRVHVYDDDDRTRFFFLLMTRQNEYRQQPFRGNIIIIIRF